VVTDAEAIAERWPQLPTGARYLIDVVSATEPIQDTLRRVLYKAAVVDDLAAARRLVDEIPGVVAVTRGGDILGAYFARGGSAERSEVETRTAWEETEQSVSRVTSAVDKSKGRLGRLQARRAHAAAHVESTLAQLPESDARMAVVAEKL